MDTVKLVRVTIPELTGDKDYTIIVSDDDLSDVWAQLSITEPIFKESHGTSKTHEINLYTLDDKLCGMVYPLEVYTYEPEYLTTDTATVEYKAEIIQCDDKDYSKNADGDFMYTGSIPEPTEIKPSKDFLIKMLIAQIREYSTNEWVIVDEFGFNMTITEIEKQIGLTITATGNTRP